MTKLSNLPPGVTDRMIEERATGEPIRTHYEPYAYWIAWRGDYDPGCLTGMGQTEQEAIDALLEREEERDE